MNRLLVPQWAAIAYSGTFSAHQPRRSRSPPLPHALPAPFGGGLISAGGFRGSSAALIRSTSFAPASAKRRAYCCCLRVGGKPGSGGSGWIGVLSVRRSTASRRGGILVQPGRAPALRVALALRHAGGKDLLGLEHLSRIQVHACTTAGCRWRPPHYWPGLRTPASNP